MSFLTCDVKVQKKKGKKGDNWWVDDEGQIVVLAC